MLIHAHEKRSILGEPLWLATMSDEELAALSLKQQSRLSGLSRATIRDRRRDQGLSIRESLYQIDRRRSGYRRPQKPRRDRGCVRSKPTE